MVGGGLWLALALLVVAVAGDEPFTLEEFVRGTFSQRGFSGTWISDTEFTFTIPNEPGIYLYDVPTQTTSYLVEPSIMSLLNTANPVLSQDRDFILAPSHVVPVYRYSRTARYALYDIDTEDITLIADHNVLQLCIFGANHTLAYVMDNNVYYVYDHREPPIQLTFDGDFEIYNGHTDWVYEEDVMYTGQATWFSTDGSYLAFASFNDTEVESYAYYYYQRGLNLSDPYPESYDDVLYPELAALKYPKVGDTNPTVVLKVVNLQDVVETRELNFITLFPPDEVSEDHILGGVTWTSPTEIAAHWLNRRQNSTVLRMCNVITLDCQDEPREQPNGWVPIALPRFSSDGSYYISTRWSEEQYGGTIFQHLFQSVRGDNGIVSSSITPGAFTVISFVGMDEENELFYFVRTVPDQPWISQIHVIGREEKCISCDLILPEGGACTRATATASTNARYLAITCQSPEEPAAVYIVDPQTLEIITTWETNDIVRERLLGKARPESIITTVPLENGFQAPVRLFLPPGLDVNNNETKYAMVYYVYSGPNTNTVFDSFTVGYHSYMTTSRNVIYMMADGRGSGLNGQEILYSLNNALGTVEIFDHFVILRQVLDRYGFIDRERVGIWGHSYGGYATLLTLVHDDDHLFKCGISTAPVTSWLYYNTMYTERYMGLPTPEDNLSGYEEGDVALLADKLRGHDFLLMHGNADDNVHFQNAAKLMTALQQLDIPFEQMSYPDEDHSIAGVGMHRYTAMNDYWARCLNLSTEVI